MATDIELLWSPDSPLVGDVVTIWATLRPIPPVNSHVWIYVDGKGLGQGQLNTDTNGQAGSQWSASIDGAHRVECDFATLPADDGTVDTGSFTSPEALVVLRGPDASPVPPPPQTAAADPGGPQGPQLENPGASIRSGSNAFTGTSNTDPFTGTLATDPYTGEPLSPRDASNYDRIKAVYWQRDAVPEATRNAIADFYNQPAIDLTGVPQSVQNVVFDIFNQVPETPLPGRGLDEVLGDAFGSALDGLFSGVRFEVRTITTVIDVTTYADELALEATVQAVRPIVGTMRAIVGAGEMVGGVAAAIGSEGLAAGISVAMAAHGLDQLVAGGRTIFGEDAQSLTEHILTGALQPAFGDRASLVAGVADTGLTAGLSAAAEFEEMGGSALRELNKQTAAARIEMSESSQLNELQPVVAPREGMETQLSNLPRSEIANISSDWSEGTTGERMVAAMRDGEPVVVRNMTVTTVESTGDTRVRALGLPYGQYELQVTGNELESKFLITENGKTVEFWPDGIVDDYLVEAKFENMGRWSRPNWNDDIYTQARRYLLVNDLMGYKGVRYEVSSYQSYMLLTHLFVRGFPDAMDSGALSVLWVPSP
jgi:hypothetical protein